MKKLSQPIAESFDLAKYLKTTQSLQASETVVDGMLQGICHNAWVKEVVAKKKEHSVGWVLSVTKELNFVEQDKKAN